MAKLTTVYEQETQSFTVDDVTDITVDQVSSTTQYLQMLEIFGPDLLDYMLGMEEADGPDDHTTNSTSLPYLHNGRIDRLRLLYKISQIILSIDNIQILHMWIIGQNPDLDYNPPATKIRDGEFLQVLVAIETYRTGSF